MVRALPPLNALRAFEAAARHLSFAKAAAELNVTPAAISHQVRQLEEHLGVALFRRLTRRVLLTDAGQACLPLLSQGFDRLAQGVALVKTSARRTLSVSVAPSFAGKWLVPRIERFTAAHPEIDIRISASMALADFRADGMDAAIRFGRGRYPGLRCDRLFLENLSPVCSPGLLARVGPIEVPDDLAGVMLLHDDSLDVVGPVADWRLWLQLAGCESVDATRGARFSHAEHAIQAACDGVGVLLGRESLVASDVSSGRLVRLFALSLPLDLGYYLVRPNGDPERPEVLAFRDWLLREARRDDPAA